MIVKPSVSFLMTDTDEKLIIDTDAILLGMLGNPAYPTPPSAMQGVSGAKTEFATAVANAVGGGRELKAIKNAKRAALVALLRQVASYVQVACNGDLAVLLSSGFPIQKPQRNPIGVLPAPSGLTVTFGARTGELNATALPMNGAAIFNWRVSAAATPNVVVQTAQTTAARYTFSGLTPGVVYNIEANVVGSAGPSNWCDPVPLMAV